MKRLVFNLSGVAWLAFLVCVPGARATTTNEPPPFKEVYDVIRAHLEGVSEAELDRAAVEGLLSKLSPRVTLVTNESSSKTEIEPPLLNQARVFDDAFAYLRVERVGEGLSKRVSAAFNDLSASNKLKGVVLDLRFVGGDDYSAACAVADLFLTKPLSLLDWGNGVVQSKTKTDAIKLPLTILVNQQTTAAAEALAAVLRETGAGLVIGTNTAGRAAIGREFVLKNGQRLRIATAEIKLGSGTVLSAQGVKPDILVGVNAVDEKAYFADAYKTVPKPTSLPARADAALTNNAANETNRPARRRLTEADLVRERREELNRVSETATAVAKKMETDKPAVHDPALARALDLLKGLAIVRQFRSL
jgi:C-terminal processing protease CtpA/Prc